MNNDLFAKEDKGAWIDGNYRYILWRVWDNKKPLVAFCMLNPSTADSYEDDPTIRRCIGFAKREDFGGIVVVNVFAYRETSPDKLFKEWAREKDIVGRHNDIAIKLAVSLCQKVILAWGDSGYGFSRPDLVIDLLFHCAKEKSYHLGDRTARGGFRHPLYLKSDSPLCKVF